MSNGNPQPALRVNVLVVFFAYGGNGGVAMQLPAIGEWWARTLQVASKDPRIADIKCLTLADTPITMTRNRAIKMARDNNFHVVVMVDSDNEPDIYADFGAKRFWDSSFEFLYQRLVVGLPTVIAAPYCGPPPHPTKGGEENVYVFHWANFESDAGESEEGYKLAAYSRAEASQMAGIHPAGALPTGLLMATVSAFDLCCPDGEPVAHFYYEWKDGWQAEKCSTEDVTATRDISLAGHILLGEEVVFCNWDCWAGHHKPKCVGKPTPPSAMKVGKVLEKSITYGVDPHKRVQYLARNFPRYAPRLSPEQAERIVDKLKQRAIPAEEEQLADTIPIVNRTIMLSNGRKVEVGWSGTEHTRRALESLADVVREVVREHPGRPIRILDVGSYAAETAVACASGCGSYGAYIYCAGVFDKDLAIQNAGDLEGDMIRWVNRDIDVIDPTGADLVVVSGYNEQTIQSALRHVGDDGVFCGFMTDVPEWGVAHGEGVWKAKTKSFSA